MKNLHFDYFMEIRYESDVDICYYTIKCIPQDSARQKISDISISLTPESKPEWAVDSLGNKYIFGCNGQPHDLFQFRITGNAECGLTEYEEVVDENELMIYRHSTKINGAGDELKAYFATISEELELDKITSAMDKAKAISNKLYELLTYEKDVTEWSTTAEEAFCLKKGVCQDYAHILISLLHLSGCSARYVTGLLIGEGETHAWVEVADNNRWYGIDPANNCDVTDSYIKIGVGRDAGDCQINRGIMHGGGGQEQDVKVVVTDMGAGRSFIRKLL